MASLTQSAGTWPAVAEHAPRAAAGAVLLDGGDRQGARYAGTADAAMRRPPAAESASTAGSGGEAFAGPFPRRAGQRVTPLIAAAAVYPALERMVLGARSRCYFAFRIFDPTTLLRSPEARDLGLDDWRDLIAHKLREDVRFCFLLADFDPVVANDLHGLAWRNARAFATIEPDRDRLQLLMTLHEGEVGAVPRTLFWPFVRRRLGGLLRDDPSAVDASPGLAHLVRHTPRGPCPGYRPVRLWPATHHQKMLVVDGGRAVIGGIDVDERRFDDSRHDRPADQTWQDVSLAMDGSIAADVERHFVEVWNHEVARIRAATVGIELPTAGVPGGWPPPTPIEPADPGPPDFEPPAAASPDAEPLDAEPTGPKPAEAAPGGHPAPAASRGAAPQEVPGSELQLGRTLSVRRRSPFAMCPVTARRDIEEQLLGVIGSAREFLYIENQFVRHMPIVDALLDALARNASLELILVVPMAPDTVAFEGRTGLDQRYAERLQTRALGRLLEAPGGRVGLFSLVGARAPENGDSSPRATAFGRGIIYLHSKVLIADDRTAHVSSANLNGRSLLMDTELGVEWRDPEAVARFRHALWRAHLGEDAVSGPERPRLADWRRLAEAALFDRERERQQRVVPYHLSRARRFSRYGFGIPKRFF